MRKEQGSTLLLAANGDNFDLPQAILELFKAKTKQKHEYVNPNFMQEVLGALESYYQIENDEVSSWVMDMFGA